MPGNEVGDRVHNFFDQDSLTQSRHHSQAVDGNWPVLSNNLWVGNQREIGAPLISNSKSINVQHSALAADSERGHASQSSRVPHGLNFTQSTLRPEFSKIQSQNQQSNLNGYMHGHQVFQTRQNEANFLGVDTEPDQHNLTSRGLFILESQRGNGPDHHKKGPMRLEATESPVNFDFLGGQQQMSGQQPGMLQSLPRQQQSGFGDMQLLQQQVMLKQMQELQRQQQLQQQEVRQQNSINRISSAAKQPAGNQPPALINGTPVHDGSNYAWPPELMTGNSSWLQRGASPVMQGSSNGLMFSPEQGQAMRMMGLVPQQVDQSLYGFPISSARGTSSQYSNNQIDKPTMQQISSSSNSFPGNQYAVSPDQVSMQDGTFVSRPGFQGKNFFGHAPGQGLNSGVVWENSQQVHSQQRNASVQEFRGRQEVAGLSETLQEKTVMQVAPSQSVVPLDPTEEKILFGTDDNLWDAFGRSTSVATGGYNLLDGTDYPNAFPTMQSGSWSALMQSAVAETSSGDVGLQEEWSGLTFPNSELPTGNHQPSAFNDSGKQQTVWADNNSQNAASLISRPFPLSDGADTSTNYGSVPGFQQSGLKYSGEKNERFQSNSSHRSIQQSSEEGSKWLDCGPLQKPLAEGSQIYGNAAHSSDAKFNAKSISGSWTHQQSTSSHNTGSQPCNKPNGSNFMETVSHSGDATLKISEIENSLPISHSNERKRAMHEEMDHGAAAWRADSVPNSAIELEHVKSAMGTQQVNREDPNLNNVSTMLNSSTTKGNQETSQQIPNSHHLDYWKRADTSMNSRGGEGSGKYQHHLGKGPQILESSVNSSDKGAVEMHEMDDKKENSSDSYRSNLSHHASTGGMRENVWLDASESRTLPGGKQKSSVQIGRKSSGSRRFQYHPMGNLDEDVEPYYGTKHVTHSQAMSQQGSRGLKSHDQGYFGQSKFVGHVTKNSMEMEKGHLPDSQGDNKGLDEVPSRGILPGFVSNVSAPFDRSVGIYAPNKTAHSSHNMLELLHKVDQSREHGTATHLSPSDRNPSSEMAEGETSDGSVGHLQRNQSSVSQGFGLQLAPPSQRLPVQNRALASQSSSPTANSLSSSLFTPEMRDKGHKWLVPVDSNQSLPPSRETSQGEFRNSKSGIPGQTVNEASLYNAQGNFSASLTSGFPYSRSQLQSQHVTGVSGQVTTNQSANVSFDRLARFKHIDDSHDRAQTGQSSPASLPDTAGSTPHNNLASPANTSQPSSTNQSHHVRVLTEQIPVSDAVAVSEPPVTSGMSQRGPFSTMLPNAWTNVSTQQRLLSAQTRKAPSSLFDSHLQSNNNSGTTSSAPQKGDDLDAQKGGDGASESGACSMNSQGFVCGEEQPVKESPWKQLSSENIDPAQHAMNAQGKGSVVKHLSDASLPNTAATQRDIEAFGRSLKPDNNLHRNYSLLHQVQAMKSKETDPSNRGLKRFKGPDCGPDAQQLAPRVGQHLPYGFNSGARDVSVNRAPVPSRDLKMLSFSTESGDNRDRNAFAQLGNIPSQDTVAFGRNDSQNDSSTNNAASVRSEHSQISPLMAPSWFDQYGTFKNGQMLHMYDARKTATLKTMEQPFIIGKSSDSLHAQSRMEHVNAAADTSQVGDVRQSSTLASIATEHFSSPCLLPPAVTDQSLVVVRPKKRKSVTSELLPWHKEVTQGSQRVQNISMAEIDWAQAANRLVEKVEDEAEMIEDGPPMHRPSRRLILTTQLMQQLLRPPPALVLSADATSNYETVAYFAARLALGDACSLVSCSGSDSSAPLDSGNLLLEKLKTSERIGDQYFLKVMEDFVARARNLENDLLRLDKRASILDLRVECQDLEKFSVINRFAKFHGRGQADGAETSSSSDAPANAQKTCPQRYVTALPMPRNLPDRVQCLSL
ncbi:hypothetical protein L1049_028193 [Liquidambar formosana]|uniref:Uncharacterized protein n=1 Tax=Liquidambar formosana TaxID=63359 RepID=A0AAP0WWM1_LIQFO